MAVAWHSYQSKEEEDGRRNFRVPSSVFLLSLQSQHILHREPPLPSLDPSRGFEGAARERGAIAGTMRDGNRFRGSVEAQRVSAGDGAGAGRPDRYFGRVAG